jgi:hypothetical protein
MSATAAETQPRSWLEPLREKLTKKITISLEETVLEEALTSLRLQTDVSIVVDPALLPDSGLEVNISVNDAPLSETLNKMLEPINLQYTLFNEAVFIFKRNAYISAPAPGAGNLSDDKIKALAAAIADLGAEDFNAREKANAVLVGFGAAAAPYLEQAIKKCTDPEVQVRLQNLLTPYKGKPFPEPAGEAVAKYLDGLTTVVSIEYEETKFEDAVKELNAAIEKSGGKPLNIELPKELQSRLIKVRATLQAGNAVRWLAILTGSTLELEGEKLKFVGGK